MVAVPAPVEAEAPPGPFQRTKRHSSCSSSASYLPRTATESLIQASAVLKTLGYEGLEAFEAGLAAEAADAEALLKEATLFFAQKWKLKDGPSEIAFKGLLIVLEFCLSSDLSASRTFESFVSALNFHTVFFWKRAVPFLYDSDMTHGTSYRDALLFSLTLYDVNKGQNRLWELFAAVPGLRDSFLGKTAKRFEEAFHNMLVRRSNPNSCRASDADAGETLSVGSDAAANLADIQEDEVLAAPGHTETNGHSNGTPKHDDWLEEEAKPHSVSTGGLSKSHFEERVINVSNAPPVSLSQKDGEWAIGPGSGGLVTCCGPVLSQKKSNMWLACFGPDAKFETGSDSASNAPATNALGIPLIRTAQSAVLAQFLHPDDNGGPDKAEVEEKMSLVGVLTDYNKESSYKLNPVVVHEADYNTYYGGISNGLLWPACHGLQEYIMGDYDDAETLTAHWAAYVRVNYQFAINAVRNSRPQDFIWIHDYHLLLVGMIMQSLDPHLEVGFFLHIPFQPPADFFERYGPVGMAVLRGLLRFTKVGFQTHADRKTFISLVQRHLPMAKIKFDPAVDSFTVRHDGWTASLGVFPVSVKNEAFLSLIADPAVQAEGASVRAELRKSMHPDGRIFFSVERFDYTKGIQEKMAAWRQYMTSHPERHGKDVLLQVAVTNRRGVDAYRIYQDETIAEADRINEDFRCADLPDWRPLIFLTEGLKRPNLVARYLAMDIGVVTPKKDGMNLVAKEMVLCNPSAGLLISCGAGTEQQLSAAGFYDEAGMKCYTRVKDVLDIPDYADAFHQAAMLEPEVRLVHGERLKEFIVEHDIEKWSSTFLDPSWSHDVIKPTELDTLNDFYSLMFQTRNVRRQIVERILKGIPIRSHFSISLRNAKQSLKTSKSRMDATTVLCLRSEEDKAATSSARVEMDVADEIQELEKDIAFLDAAADADGDDIEKFISTLESYHSESPEKYREELEAVVALMTAGDHFNFFFTDRDGTLKPYACSYASSIQPSYSGVIQATFAHRCTQNAAILTSAPLINVGILDVNVMPDGYFAYGASCGREWYVEASRKFKDTSIPESDLETLEALFDAIHDLIETERYMDFKWVGSGLQKHFGQITVAKQDVYGSVDVDRSRQWFQTICELVSGIDPSGKTLAVKESDTDIKIHLKSHKLSGNIFSKGNGIRLFASHMGYNLAEGRILICGDSDTDLPMLKEALALNPHGTYTVWVTKSPELHAKVRGLCAAVGNGNFAFASCPSVLLGAMAQATIREIAVRPTTAAVMDDL